MRCSVHRARGAARAPLVVAGDFNDWGNQIKRMLAGFGLFEYEGKTEGADLSLAPADGAAGPYLCARPDAAGLQVPKGRIWWRMSDHLPLIAEFRL
jgi:endonuclease/exonuclease/phosphatase (EEP) superfamily protein YafD